MIKNTKNLLLSRKNGISKFLELKTPRKIIGGKHEYKRTKK